MAPEEISSQLNALIDDSDILSGQFSVEAALMLASALTSNRKLSAAFAWSSLGYSVASRGWRQLQAHRKAQEKVYTIKVTTNDDIFAIVSDWLLKETPEEEQYVVEAQRVYGRIADSFDEEDALTETAEDSGAVLTGNDRYKNVALDVDDDRLMTLNIDGYELSVQYIVPGQQVERGDEQTEKYVGEPHFLISCPNIDARRAFLKKVDESFVSTEKRRPRVWRADSFGNMDSSGDVPARQLDTVILKGNQIDLLIDDVSLFLRSEKKYVDLGIPYHHGVLLYGPPGTGKTSLAAAVAHSLDLDVFVIQLNNVQNDASLNNLLRSTRTRSVLLLEDIDTLRAAREGNDAEKGVTIDGLLQALDGFASPHGLVTIMTTNKLETLDHRLIRAGRVDMRMEIGYVDTDQVERLTQRFLGYVPEGMPELVPSDGVSPADVVGVFKMFLHNKAEAGPALVKRLNELLDTKTR